MSFNFPLSGYVGTRSNYYNFTIDGYQYVKNIRVGVHFYQLDDNLYIYLNNRHIISQDRAWCFGSEWDCVINNTFYYTIPASSLNLTSNNLSFRVDHYNSGRDGVCTGAWFSFEVYY